MSINTVAKVQPDRELGKEELEVVKAKLNEVWRLASTQKEAFSTQ